MSIFNTFQEILHPFVAKYQHILKLISAVAIALLLIYSCVTTLASNAQLKIQLGKISSERAYVLNAVESYLENLAFASNQQDPNFLEDFLTKELRFFNNTSIQKTNDSIVVAFDLNDDFDHLASLIEKLSLNKNFKLNEVTFINHQNILRLELTLV